MAVATLRAALLAATLGVVPLATGWAGGNGGTTVVLTIRFSHFHPDTIDVPPNVPITFILRNEDPIDHEWIIGPEAVHQIHRSGTEPYHATRPNEVTVPALTTRVTTLTFMDGTEFRYICHLPGHEQYGMVGTLRAGNTGAARASDD